MRHHVYDSQIAWHMPCETLRELSSSLFSISQPAGIPGDHFCRCLKQDFNKTTSWLCAGDTPPSLLDAYALSSCWLFVGLQERNKVRVFLTAASPLT